MVKRKFMLAAVLTVFAFVLASCNDFAMPKEARVQGAPGFYLPVGSPFDKKQLVNDFKNIDEVLKEIREKGNEGKKPEERKVGIVKYEHNDILLGGDDVFHDGSTPNSVNGIEDVQTYLIHYPISELPVDLTKYMAGLKEVSIDDVKVGEATGAMSDLPGTPPIYVGPDMELYTLNFVYPSLLSPFGITDKPSEDTIPAIASIDILNDTELGKWMRDIEVAPGSGIKIESDDPGVNLEGKIEMKIPALGIKTFQPIVPGTGEHSGEFVILSDGADPLYEKTTLLRKDGSTLPNPFDVIEVFIKIVDPAITGTLKISLVFEWKKAVVLPSGAGDRSGTFPIPASGITDYLGGNKFASVPAYIYISGFNEIAEDTGSDANVTMKLRTGNETPGAGDHWFYGNEDTNEGQPVEFSSSFKDFYAEFAEEKDADGNSIIGTFDKELPVWSNMARIMQMEPLLNSSDETSLYYNIHVEELPVNNDDVAKDITITADLVIVLPLYFDVSTEANASAENWPEEEDRIVTALDKNYIKLFLEDLENFNEDFGDDDLLADYRDSITLSNVAMHFKITNEITDDLFIGIKANDKDTTKWKVYSLKQTPQGKPQTISFTGKEIDPFTPKFVALVPEDVAGSGHGPFAVKPFTDTSGFYVSIAVEANAELDMTIPFY